MFGGRQYSEEEKAAAKVAAVDKWRKAVEAWRKAVANVDAAAAIRAMAAWKDVWNSTVMDGMYPARRRADRATGAAAAAWGKAVVAVDEAMAATDAASIAVFESCCADRTAKEGEVR